MGKTSHRKNINRLCSSPVFEDKLQQSVDKCIETTIRRVVPDIIKGSLPAVVGAALHTKHNELKAIHEIKFASFDT